MRHPDKERWPCKIWIRSRWLVVNSQAHSARLGRSRAFLRYNHLIGALRERCLGRLLYLLEIFREINLPIRGLQLRGALIAAGGSSRNPRTMWSKRHLFSRRSSVIIRQAPIMSTGQRSVESTFNNNNLQYLSFLSIAIPIAISPRSISPVLDGRNLAAL